MRSLPPAICSFSPYSCSDQRTGSPNSCEHVVERREVAVALGVGEHAVAVEDRAVTTPCPRCRTGACGSAAIATTSARTA